MNKIITALLILSMVGCTIEQDVQRDGAPTTVPLDVLAVRDAVPKYEKRTRAGNPGEYEVLGKRYKVLPDSKGYKARGIASWYGTKFHGKNTSNGEVYDMYAMTAAHKTLPIPSYVRVTNLENQRNIVVRINDRGPFHENRIIDLSCTAAAKLGIQKTGTGFVEVTALDVEPSKQSIETKTSQVDERQTVVFLQVGAFSQQQNARQLQQKLISGQVEKSRVVFSQNQSGELYKVQVGPLYSVQQADHESEKLALLGLTETQLIVEPD